MVCQTPARSDRFAPFSVTKIGIVLFFLFFDAVMRIRIDDPIRHFARPVYNQ